MPTNDRGDLGRTKLCRLCKMRCTKIRDFHDPSVQTGEREKHLARIACRFCISHMVDRGEVNVANGVLQIFKMPCRRCGEAKTPAEMSNFCWCKKCCAAYQKERGYYKAKKKKHKQAHKQQQLSDREALKKIVATKRTYKALSNNGQNDDGSMRAAAWNDCVRIAEEALKKHKKKRRK